MLSPPSSSSSPSSLNPLVVDSFPSSTDRASVIVAFLSLLPSMDDADMAAVDDEDDEDVSDDDVLDENDGTLSLKVGVAVAVAAVAVTPESAVLATVTVAVCSATVIFDPVSSYLFLVSAPDSLLVCFFFLRQCVVAIDGNMIVVVWFQEATSRQTASKCFTSSIEPVSKQLAFSRENHSFVPS